jgi:Predicted N-acetylglucosamine kinase
MKYVLGIDSGGTKFKIKAANLSGNLLAEYFGPCSSHYVVGIDGAQELIASSVSACLKLFNGKPDECAALVCGTTGWDSDEDGALINGFISDSLVFLPHPMHE